MQRLQFFLKYESGNENLRNYKCLSCNKNYSKRIEENLKDQRFKNIFKFSSDIKKIISLLRKGIYE